MIPKNELATIHLLNFNYHTTTYKLSILQLLNNNNNNNNNLILATSIS